MSAAATRQLLNAADVVGIGARTINHEPAATHTQ
jgi:hypothetical protein